LKRVQGILGHAQRAGEMLGRCQLERRGAARVVAGVASRSATLTVAVVAGFVLIVWFLCWRAVLGSANTASCSSSHCSACNANRRFVAAAQIPLRFEAASRLALGFLKLAF